MQKTSLLLTIRNRTALLALATTLGVGLAAQSAEESFLVEDGKAQAAIVIAKDPTRMQKLAAEELQKYVQKISGAELPIGTAPVSELPMSVYVGESEHTPSSV